MGPGVFFWILFFVCLFFGTSIIQSQQKNHPKSDGYGIMCAFKEKKKITQNATDIKMVYICEDPKISKMEISFNTNAA